MCGLILSMYAVTGTVQNASLVEFISLMQFIDDNVCMKQLCFA